MAFGGGVRIAGFSVPPSSFIGEPRRTGEAGGGPGAGGSFVSLRRVCVAADRGGYYRAKQTQH